MAKQNKKKAAKNSGKQAENLPAVQTGKALDPYGLTQPYSLEGRIQQLDWLFKQDVMSHFAKGCILLDIQSHEKVQTFGLVLSERFPGLSRSTAFNYMAFAKKCKDMPSLVNFAEDNWSKAIALLDGCTDEQLKEIEEHGIDGKVLDEYDGMSVREFKQLINDLKSGNKKATDEATKSLKAENKELRNKLEALHKGLPGEDINAYINEYVPEIEKAFIGLGELLDGFAFDARTISSPEAQSVVESFFQRQVARLSLFDEKWRAHNALPPRVQK